jgi:hypothetical protein
VNYPFRQQAARLLLPFEKKLERMQKKKQV